MSFRFGIGDSIHHHNPIYKKNDRQKEEVSTEIYNEGEKNG